jgi:excinuclease ABC subunit C
MRHFQSLDAMKNATVEELKELPSMNEKTAIQIYKFFHP